MSFLLTSLHFPSSLSALDASTGSATGAELSGKLLINTINAHSYNMARKDPEFAEALKALDVLFSIKFYIFAVECIIMKKHFMA